MSGFITLSILNSRREITWLSNSSAFHIILPLHFPHIVIFHSPSYTLELQHLGSEAGRELKGGCSRSCPFPAKSFKMLTINTSLNMLQLKPRGIFVGIQRSFAIVSVIFPKRFVCIIPERVYKNTQFRSKHLTLNDGKDPLPFWI